MEGDMDEFGQEFRLVGGVLHIRLSGKFPSKLLYGEENLFRPVIDACSPHNCKKVLIDARALVAEFDTLALYRAGTDAAFLAGLGVRMALVASADMRDTFFDDVVSNRGGDVGVFTDMDSARGWLES
jgi:hypothetical protein